MPIWFNSVLTEAGLSLEGVRLLRHQDARSKKGFMPYDLWRDDPAGFDRYQSHQSIKNRPKFSKASHWATFVGTPDNGTLFVGLYQTRYRGVLDRDVVMPHTGETDRAGNLDVYDIARCDVLNEFSGKLWIEWGPSPRAWVQRAHKKNKIVVELKREFKEPDFPGYGSFLQPLSKIESLPANWIAALKVARGVYLLTCPRTKEQYVGKADGAGGFWSRWSAYVQSGHGGNVGLKSRDPSDYEVSILEVAGSSASALDIRDMEQRWKEKLRSREMGLNRN